MTILPGDSGGRYPDGNAVVVRGGSEAVLIDPTLTIAVAADPPAVDRVLLSHGHEDHIAGLCRYADQPVYIHDADALALESLDGLMTIYGMAPAIEAPWREDVLQRFHYAPRPDAQRFTDGARFDLGGGVHVQVVHLPGHTRGHSGFFVEPDGVMILADVDLSGFGPYYGDAWSSLDDWDRSLDRCRGLDARRYVTFHHKGVIDGRAAFLAALADYAAVIDRREQAYLQFLTTPHTIGEMVTRRFIYRPHVDVVFADAVERRSAELHLARLVAQGLVREVEPGRYLRS